MHTIQKFTTLILFLLFICATPRVFGQEDESDSPTSISELQQAIEEVLEKTRNPSVGLALVMGDSVHWVAGLGIANKEDSIPATDQTMYRIGSVSKMFASLSILKLQEEGRVSLKDKVRDLVPEIEFDNPWADEAPILVEHLLEHTTGWDDIHMKEYAYNVPEIPLKDGLDYHPLSRTSRWMPGTRMSYCNSGPPVAAYIVEKITGKQFEDYVQEIFFDPMGMTNMTYFETEDYKKYGATLYQSGEPQDYWYIIMRASGSINATPSDMAKLVRMYVNRGKVDTLQLISEASLQRMETPMTTVGARAGLGYGYGLSNYLTSHKGTVFRGHNGGVNGGLTELSYSPKHNVGYAFMINSSSGEAFGKISDLIRDYLLQGIAKDSIVLTPSPDVDVAGLYRPINPRVQMLYFFERFLSVQKVWHEGDTTYRKDVLSGNPIKYVATAPDEFTSPVTGQVSMVQTEDPLAGRVLQANSQVLQPVSKVTFYIEWILIGLWLLGMFSAMIFGMIWVIKYLMGKILGGAPLWIRLWPVIASFLFFLVFVMFIVGAADPFRNLGEVGFVSISILVLTLAFGIISLWSLIYAILKRRTDTHQFAYWYSVCLASLHTIATIYLMTHGVIGIRVWS